MSKRQKPPPTTLSPEPETKPKPVATSGVEPMANEKVKLRAKSMRAEFMQNPDDKKEFLLSMDDLSGTPNAGAVIVHVNVDYAIECQDAERDSIIMMLSTLYENGKLSPTDFQPSVSELIQFIGDFVIDSPRVFEYLGKMLAEFIHIRALTVPWMCQQCTKLNETNPNNNEPEKVIKATIDAMKEKHGTKDTKTSFSGAAKDLVKLLGADKWASISSEKLV